MNEYNNRIMIKMITGLHLYHVKHDFKKGQLAINLHVIHIMTKEIL